MSGEHRARAYLVGDALEVGHGALPHPVQGLLLANLLQGLADVLVDDTLARDHVLNGLVQHLRRACMKR